MELFRYLFRFHNMFILSLIIFFFVENHKYHEYEDWYNLQSFSWETKIIQIIIWILFNPSVDLIIWTSASYHTLKNIIMEIQIISAEMSLLCCFFIIYLFDCYYFIYI